MLTDLLSPHSLLCKDTSRLVSFLIRSHVILTYGVVRCVDVGPQATLPTAVLTRVGLVPTGDTNTDRLLDSPRAHVKSLVREESWSPGSKFVLAPQVEVVLEHPVTRLFGGVLLVVPVSLNTPRNMDGCTNQVGSCPLGKGILKGNSQTSFTLVQQIPILPNL